MSSDIFKHKNGPFTCKIPCKIPYFFPAPDELDIFGRPRRASGSDYFPSSEGANYFRDNDIVINAANPRICYNETVYEDILNEPTEYYGLTLIVFKENPDDDDARIRPGYDTAVVRIVDNDGRVYVCLYHQIVSPTEQTISIDRVWHYVYSIHYTQCHVYLLLSSL